MKFYSQLLLSLDDDNESVSDGLSELELYDVLVPELSSDALLLLVIETNNFRRSAIDSTVT